MVINIAKLIIDYGAEASIKDLWSLFCSTLAIIVSVLTLLNYRRLWLYDTFLREEIRILLEFRKQFVLVQDTIRWFLHDLMGQKKYGFHLENPPIINRATVIEHFNKINEINNFYNENQHIFRKYKLEEDIELLTCFLEVGRMLPKEDLFSYLVSKPFEKEGDIEEYTLYSWGNIVSTFYMSAYQLLHPLKDESDFKEMCKTFENSPEESFNKVKQTVSTRLVKLSFKIDKMCLYPNKKHKELNFRKMSKYPNMED